MTEMVDHLAPEPSQSSSSGRACGKESETYGEFTGITGWIDRPWVFRIALGFIAIVYLASVTTHWYPTSDSALYLMLGDNLADGEGYTLWGEPHVHVPPGFPLLLAGLKLVGIDSDLGRNIVMMLIAWGSLTCCYFALRELVSSTFAKWLLLLVAFSHVMHLASVRQLSDVPFMGIVWLGLWCQLRGLRTGSRSLEIGSLLLLLSCLFRVAGIPIALGAAVGLLLQQSQVSRKRLWLNACFLAVILLVLFQVAVHVFSLGKSTALPNYFSLIAQGMSPSGFWQPVQNLLDTAPELSILMTGQKNDALGAWVGLLWLPVILGAVICWKQGKVFGVCILGSYLLSLLLMRPLIARYLLPISPVIFWFALEGFRWVVDRTRGWQPNGRRIALACVLALLAINLPKAGKLSYRLHYPKIDNSYIEESRLHEVAEYLKQNGSPENLFLTNNNERILAYLSGRWTVPRAAHILRYNPPTPALLERVELKSASHFVLSCTGKRRSYRRLDLLIKKHPHAAVVFRTENYKVYRLQPKLAMTEKENVAKAGTRKMR